MLRTHLIIPTIIGLVGITACSDVTALKTDVAAYSPAFLASSPRSGALHVTKECSAYTGQAGSYCTITSSNVKGIEVGTRVVYASNLAGATLNTDVRLDPPGPGNNIAFGHVVLDLAAGQGVVTVSGGTGKFSSFQASAAVTYLGGPNWAWDGTYSFSPRD